MYYIYILHNELANKFYVGHSNDPWSRLSQHNSNSTKTFTGKYSTWKLAVVFKVSESKGEVDKVEKFIKKQKNRLLLIKLIDPNFIPEGILAQLVRVPHVRD